MQLREQLSEGPIAEQEEMMPPGGSEYDDANLAPEEMAPMVDAPGVSGDGMPALPPDLSASPAAPASSGFNPDDSLFSERQKNMTAQERADWATKKWGGTSAAAETPAAEPKQDYAAKRKMFEDEIFKAIGGNPFERDVMKEVDKHTLSDLEKVFNRAFGGKVIWQDRHRLDKKQNAFWQNEVKAFRAYVKEQVESEKKTQIDRYKHHMGRFDVEMKMAEAEKKQAAERASKITGGVGKKDPAAAQEKAVKTERTRLSALNTKLMADIVANSKALADADPKQKAILLKQQELLLDEQAAATSEYHQFRLQTDPGYRDAFKQKQEEIAAQRAMTVQSHREGEREASGNVPASKPAGKAAAPAPAAAEAKPAAAPQKSVQSTRVKADGSGDKLVTYTDGTSEIVHPDGTTEPAKKAVKK